MGFGVLLDTTTNCPDGCIAPVFQRGRNRHRYRYRCPPRHSRPAPQVARGRSSWCCLRFRYRCRPRPRSVTPNGCAVGGDLRPSYESYQLDDELIVKRRDCGGQGYGKVISGGLEPDQASFHPVADEPSALPAIASNQRPERNIIAGSAAVPPAWIMTPAVAPAPSAILPWPCCGGAGVGRFLAAEVRWLGMTTTRGARFVIPSAARNLQLTPNAPLSADDPSPRKCDGPFDYVQDRLRRGIGQARDDILWRPQIDH